MGSRASAADGVLNKTLGLLPVSPRGAEVYPSSVEDRYLGYALEMAVLGFACGGRVRVAPSPGARLSAGVPCRIQSFQDLEKAVRANLPVG